MDLCLWQKGKKVVKMKNENRDPIGGIAITLIIVGVLVMLVGGVIQQEITNREQKEEEENGYSLSYLLNYNPDFTGIWIMVGGVAIFGIGIVLIDYSKKYKNYISRQERKHNEIYNMEYIKYKNKQNKR